MTSLIESRTRAEAMAATFVAAGAQALDLPHLLPAEVLLDLYGEDIRARAYITQDPDLGEMMLRPDFTVPLVERHMSAVATPARYTYLGDVFRVPPQGSGRARSYVQVGYELFGGAEDGAADDAEVFGLFAKLLDETLFEPVTGDMGILIAAVDSLDTTDRRRRALRRHLWRPHRFRALFDRFAGRAEASRPRQTMIAGLKEAGAEGLLAEAGPEIGLRRMDAVRERLEILAQDADAPPIPAVQADVLDAILRLRAPMTDAHEALSDMSVDLPGIQHAVDAMARRMDALSAKGLSPDTLAFEASYGRTNMEYYDGFVFGFLSRARPDLPPVASGGRYDALTAVLGKGTGVPAVGGVIRPDLVAQAEVAA